MKILIKNIVLWLLIGSGIFTGTDIANTRKKVKRSNYNSKEFIEFTVAYPLIIMMFAVGGFLFCLFCTVEVIKVLKGLLSGTADIYTLMIFVGGMIFYVILIMGTVIWRIEYKDKMFIYRDYFGIKHRIREDDITKLVIKVNRSGQESYRAYSGDKKLFTIDELTENQFTFYMWAEHKGIEIIRIEARKK